VLCNRHDDHRRMDFDLFEGREVNVSLTSGERVVVVGLVGQNIGLMSRKLILILKLVDGVVRSVYSGSLDPTHQPPSS
jgi:hypothetical protein